MPLELIKVFDHKTNRVKSLSFHPRRPWIIISLHTGLIQLWDYYQGILLAVFSEHEGPIRSVSFHSSQNIFVSGGDDAKIKVWNCQSLISASTSCNPSEPSPSRSLFTLSGHTDYIRSVSFHNECPWILSASDDQTIRIWNWQSRQCLSILTGHNHYVMHASFSPLGDMIASCSLDQTIRIWDISVLLRKSSAPSGTINSRAIGNTTTLSSSSSPSSSYPDLFAPSEVMVKHILEGHERGINFISWHPSGQMLVSASDDRLVKVWQLDSFRAWEIDTYSGHFNNVSCAIFAYHGDIIISDSEDRTLRVWDTHSKTSIFTFKKENDRFWYISAHPNTAPESQLMIFAAAHDNGFSVFKLERDVPPTTLIHGIEKSVLYVSSGCVLNAISSLHSKHPEKISICLLLGNEKSTVNTLKLGESPIYISHNSGDGSILALYKNEAKTHVELFLNVFSLENLTTPSHQHVGVLTSALTLPALGAVFISRNRFIVLDESGSFLFLSSTTDKNTVKRMSLPLICDNIFISFIPNCVYLASSSNDKLVLFDIQQERIIAEASSSFLSGSSIIFSCSSLTLDIVAFASKIGIMIFTKKFEENLSNVTNSGNFIESLALDDSTSAPVFFYSTFYNIHYVLPFGEIGIVLQTPSPVFITGIILGNSIGIIDTRGVFNIVHFDSSEIMFKYSLERRDYRALSSIISSGDLVGQSMIAYLCRKGHPKLALKYVKDTQTRFDLSLECLDMDMALSMAQKLDLTSCWEKLSDKAMINGRINIVEECYRRLLISNQEEFSYKLLFLWIITGQLDKLKRFRKENSFSSPLFDFYCAFAVEDKESIVRMLEFSEQHMLAFAFSKINGLLDIKETSVEQDRILTFLSSLSISNSFVSKSNPGSECEWPTITALIKSQEPSPLNQIPSQALLPGPDIHIEDSIPVDHIGESFPHTAEVTSQAWGIDDFEIDPFLVAGFQDNFSYKQATEQTSCLPGIDPIHSLLSYSSSVPAEQILIGNFESAIMLLNNKYKISVFKPLKEKFLTLYSTCRLWLSSSASLLSMKESLSLGLITPPAKIVQNLYTKGLALTTAGKFVEAYSVFIDALQYCALFLGSPDTDFDILKTKCREYILGLSIELRRRSINVSPDSIGKSIGLSFLFTQCALESIHRLLTLRSALSLAVKFSNYRMGSFFARKILQENQLANSTNQLPLNVISQIQKTLIICEENIKKAELNGTPVDTNPPFPSSNVYISGSSLKYICAHTFEAVWDNTSKDEPRICPYCNACYHKSLLTPFVCEICQLCEITN